MQRLPIGIQDFHKLRTEGYAYVDKTEHIHRVINQAPYLFLSRPRRFGKSLTVATMAELFRRRKELFEGLWIYNHWDWEAPPNPVIWLKFAKMSYRTRGLAEAISRQLNSIAEEYGLALDLNLPLKENFAILIRRLHDTLGRVVILVDEYDKPLIDFLGDLEQLEDNRVTLKDFYSVIKDSDPYIQTLFLTGVSAFSKVSLFSDLNNLYNISLDRSAYHLTGITEQEIDQYFTFWLEDVDREKMRRWYNGYSWGSDEKVYNPFSLISFLQGRDYRNYWFETGTPSFLIAAMKQHRYVDVTTLDATESDLTSFNPSNLHPTSVLFQTGYVTIINRGTDPIYYELAYPNVEVRQAMQQYLLSGYLEQPGFSAGGRVFRLVSALRKRDLKQVFTIANSLFAALPYDVWKRDDEHYFHAIFHLIFALSEIYIQSEVHVAGGRCDVLTQFDDYVMAIEFKRDEPVAAALRQIHERGYLRPFADDGRPVLAVGVRFSMAERQIVDWGVEEVG